MRRNVLLVFIIIYSFSLGSALAVTNKYVYTKSGLTQRTEPSLSGKKIQLLPFNSKVTILKVQLKEEYISGRIGKWAYVRFKGKTGWVFNGFLSNFKPNNVINEISKYYRAKYKKEYPFSKMSGYTKFKNDEVLIKSIQGDYILVKIPLPVKNSSDKVIGDVVWRYKLKELKEIYNPGYASDISMLFINKDKKPDFVMVDSCCGTSAVSIFLGSESGFSNNTALTTKCTIDDFYISFGKCGNLNFNSIEHVENNKNIILNERNILVKDYQVYKKYYRFDCSSNRITNYKTKLLSNTSGVILKVDPKDESIILESKLKYYYSNIPSSSHNIKNFAIGKSTSFLYEKVGEKNYISKMFNTESNSEASISGIIEGIDPKKGLIALRLGSTLVYLYYYNEDKRIENMPSRFFRDLKLYEYITITLSGGKIVRIKSDGFSENIKK